MEELFRVGDAFVILEGESLHGYYGVVLADGTTSPEDRVGWIFSGLKGPAIGPWYGTALVEAACSFGSCQSQDKYDGLPDKDVAQAIANACWGGIGVEVKAESLPEWVKFFLRVKNECRVETCVALNAALLVSGARDPLEYEGVRKWAKACFNMPSKQELIMAAIDEGLDTCGVECVKKAGRFAIYCNNGHTYSPTVMCEKGVYFVSSFGDWLEFA